MGNMTLMKAVSIFDARNYVLERFGEEGQQKVLALLSPADREALFGDSVLPVSWIEVATVVRHVEAYDRAFGTGDGRAARSMLRAVANKQFHGIYSKSFEKAPSPEKLIEKSPRLWKRFYDGGNITVEARGPGHFVSKILDYPGLPLNHEILFIPYWEEVLAIAGAKNVTIEHTQCVAKGADCCVSDYRWR